MKMQLVVCESPAAITTHVREVSDDFPIRLAGHSPRPLSLCDRPMAWDTKLPLSSVRCRRCLEVLAARRGDLT